MDDSTDITNLTDNSKNNGLNSGGTNVTFEKLRYSVTLGKGQNLPILKGLTGSFVPGNLSALMGPSGSGKTSLMDLLAGRKNSGEVQGSILYNGKKPTVDDYRSTVGYVEQFDTLVGELTVEQMLQYTAELKLPRTTTSEEREVRVKEVLQMLDLESCRDTVIGNALRRGISGGQAKRVNIGLALIQRPPVLFLDEPTSGLDSRTANEVVELLRTLAHQGGRTVVCTIHSPSGHAFSLFDELYMIHKGQTIYNGPVAAVQEYFEAQGHERTAVASLPEWLVDLTSDMERIFKDKSSLTVTRKDGQSGLPKVSDFVTVYERSQLKKQVDKERHELFEAQQQQLSGSVGSKKATAESQAPPSEPSKLLTLLKYRTLAHYSDREFVGPRFGDKILFALLFISLYWQIGKDIDPRSVSSISSLFFFIAAKCGFGAASFVPALTLERQLYYRELADGCYAPITYYLAKFVEEAFIAMFTSLVFTVVVFFGCALRGNFGIFFLTYYLTTLVGVILAYAFSAYFSSLAAANSWLPTYVTVNLYFSGFVILYDKIPAGWQWFSWTSFMRYSWGAMMVDNFQSSEPGSVSVFFDAEGNAQTVLEFYGMTEGPIMDSPGACLGLLTVILAFFTVLGVLALVYIRHDKR